MKKLLSMLTIIVGLIITTIDSSAQTAPTGVTLDDYTKCIEYCKGLTNSEERIVCMQGCAKVGNVFTSVGIRTLEKAPNLTKYIDRKPLQEGENQFYYDAKSGLKYFAIVSNGQLIDYLVKDKSGSAIPSRTVSVEKEKKRCFIYVNGKLVEVRCPDVIIIVHELISMRASKTRSSVSEDIVQPSRGEKEKSVGNTEPVSLTAYPNPSSDRVTVNFIVPRTQPISVKVYNSQGKEIAKLFQGEAKANLRHELEWKASNQEAGMYLIKLTTAEQVQSHKLLLKK